MGSLGFTKIWNGYIFDYGAKLRHNPQSPIQAIAKHWEITEPRVTLLAMAKNWYITKHWFPNSGCGAKLGYNPQYLIQVFRILDCHF